MLKLQVIGHLGQDARVQEVNSKVAINFSVAHTEKYKDNEGTKERTTWVNCTLWRDKGKDNVSQYLTKGKLVFVEGFPAVRTYKNNQQVTMASLEMRVDDFQFLGAKTAEQAGDEEHGEQQQYSAGAPAEDDLPF